MVSDSHYDIVILGGWASGLFCSVFLPKEMKKCILERSDRVWTKLLLSGWERCNLTNISVSPADYVGQNTKRLPSVFHAFSNEDMIRYLHEYGIETQVEATGKVYLKTGKAKQLRDFLLQQAEANATDIFFQQDVVRVTYFPDETYRFLISTKDATYHTKNLIVATGGKSFPQVGATGIGYELAEQFGLQLVAPRRALCGIETIEDLSALAGNTLDATIEILSWNKVVYQKQWSLLFTHWWISGPVVFDATLFLTKPDMKIRITFAMQTTNVKVSRFFHLSEKNNYITLWYKDLRPREEAKVTCGGVALDDLDQSFQSKKTPWLYFIGEVLDITGRSWWYNLQRVWSSSYVCAKWFSNKK